MKTFLKISLLFIIPLSSYAGNNETAVQSEIREVTVFLSGAQVTRNAAITLEAGTQTLFFAGLPQTINPQSIQVKGTGNFTILSVNHRINYLRSRESTVEIRMLTDSLEALKSQLSIQKAMLTAYQEEENLILANKQLGGQNTGVNVTDLKMAADFFRTTLMETGKMKLKINQDIVKLNDAINRINNQLGLLNAPAKPTSEVLVAVTAKSAMQGSLTLSYVVQEASWIPAYDLRATDIKSPVELTYKANVSQNSGEDWKNVHLTLSTGNPALEGTKPTLYPWYLSFLENNPMYKSMNAPEMMRSESKDEEAAASGYAIEKKTAGTTANYTEMKTGQTTVSFDIAIPWTVLSNAQQYAVEIQRNSLNANYQYSCVPKMDPDVFLIARVTGWETLNLLPGEMNLFFEGTYVGKSYVDVLNTGDTLDISLGRDKSIVVKRERKTEFTGSQFIGGNRKDSRAFELSARNNKKQDILLVIEDQVPVSTNKEISVEATEISSGSLQKESGKVVWRLNLKPGENKSWRMSYEVKYPKDKKVVLE